MEPTDVCRGNAERVQHTDYTGKRATVLHYTFAGYRVREWPDGSMLVELRAGRWRSFPAGHKVCREIVAGEMLSRVEENRVRHKGGTHEPFIYYIDRDGRVGVPPQPGLPPPDNVTVHTANTLQEADRLAATMREQMYREFQDDGVATAFWDRQFGYDRQEIVRATTGAPTAKGREIARQLLSDLDREAADRQRITTGAYFHWREHDGR